MAKHRRHELSLAADDKSGDSMMPGVIKLSRYAQNTIIEPYSDSLLRLLCSVFFTLRYVPIDDAKLGYRLQPRFWPLVFVGEDYFGTKVIEAYAGLEPLVRELLKREGYRLQCEPLSSRRLPPPSGKRPPRITLLDHALLRAVASRDRALIRYTKGSVSPAKLIAQIGYAWPQLRIMVWVTRVDDAKRLAAELRKYFTYVPVHYSGRCPDTRSRIVVSTYGQLGAASVEIEKRDIGIALHAAELIRNNEARQALRAARKARFYGLLPAQDQLARYDQDYLTALFGTHPVSIPAHGREYRPVDVVSTRVSGGPRPGKHADTLTVKQQGIWRHPVRNRRICSLAVALSHGDDAVIASQFPDVARNVPEGRRLGRIAILVDNVDHGQTLSKLLFDAPLVVGQTCYDAGLSQLQQQCITSGRDPRTRTQEHVIVTTEGLKRAGNFDIIIRADGGLGLPHLPQKLLTAPSDRPLPRLLLIHMADKHHPKLRKWTRYRRQAYAAAGWNLLDTAPQTALERFIAARPEVELP
jgi:hypothetical protein